MKAGSKEFYELQDQFERDLKTMPIYIGASKEKESKDLWSKGYFYINGDLNKLFIGYMFGYSNAKSLVENNCPVS